MGFPVRLNIRGRCVVIAAILSLVGRVSGQPPAPGGGLAPPTQLENVKPDVYYLRDANGNLVLVPDLSLEEFNRVANPVLAAQGALPPYSLPQVVLSGKVGDDRGELQLRVEIKVDGDSKEPIRVPLGLSSAILREATYEGPGKAAVTFDRTTKAYVCWLRADPSTRHVLTLDLLVAIRRVGDTSRLELPLPDALTHISLILNHDRPEVVVEGDQFLSQAPRALEEGGTKIEVDGYGGILQMRWTRADESTNARPSLNVNATTTLTVEDPTYLRAEMVFELRAERGEVRTFHVRLPPGMALVGRETTGFSAQIVEPGADGRGALVRIDLDSPTDKGASVRLFGEISHSTAGTAPIETVGYEVREAFYQRTELLLAVDGEWSVRTDQMRNVRRVGSLNDADRRLGGIAKYIFYANRSQPASLRVSVQPQESLITIEPRYVLRVVEQRALLDLILKFHVRGAAAKGFELSLGDWTLRDIRPSELFDFGASPRGGDPKLLPITFASDPLPALGEFEVRVRVERPVNSNGVEPTALELIRVQGASQAQDQSITVVPASLAVTASDNLEFTPALTAMPELTPTADALATWLPPDLSAEIGTQRVLYFQAAAGAEPPRFVSLIRRRPRVIAARSEIAARFESGQFDVRQTIVMDVRHQPLETLVLEGPSSLASQGPVTILLGDEPLSVTTGPIEGSTDRLRIRCELPVPLLGPGTVHLSYRLAMPNPPDDRRQAYSLPAATIGAEAMIVDSTTQVSLQANASLWQFDLPTSEWRIERGEGAGRTYRAAGLIDAIPLEISPAAADGPAEAQRVWYQTVFTGPTRVDRAVFRVQTGRPAIDIQLPPGASVDPTDITVAVNGHESSMVKVNSEGLLSVALDTEQPSAEFVVETWYTFEPDVVEAMPSRIEFARLRGASGLFVTYWQLVMPSHLHLLVEPTGMTPEHQWKWHAPFFGRECHMRQGDLEDWAGAIHADAIGGATNQYLYSSYGGAEPVELRVASRASLVLVGSGLCLALGFAWIYLPVSRHPAALMVLAIAGMAAVLIRPSLGLLISQAASAGVLLVIASRLAERLFARRPVPARATRSVRTGASDSARSDSIVSVPTLAETHSPSIRLEMSSSEARP